ncbi:hypothetical protein G6M02_08250 [Agrobacterium rhizogenes]|nr:hypothetical protein [Rhizobium rhizogenes]
MTAILTILSSIFSWALKTFGLAGCALVIVLVYYNGFPLLNRYPWLSNIPIIGQFAVGHVETYAVDQVKIATAAQKAACDAKLEQTVSTFQYDALAAQMAQETRLRTAAEQANTEASKRAVTSQQAEATASAELSRLRIEASKNKKLSSPTDEDIQWLSVH